MIPRRFEAEILFLNPDDAPRAAEALAAVNCDFEVDHEAIDPDSSAIFGWATGSTELDESDLADWLHAIVEPLGGDLVQWGFRRAP
jgi:hypothetical protein